MRRRWRAANRLATALAALAVLAFAPGVAAAPTPPLPEARAWVLVDAADREQLAARAASSRRAIASTTKLMTAYLALRELPQRRKLKAADYRPSSPAETLVGLSPGERMSVRDLLHALLLGSANDAAVTIAEGVSGSVPKFVREMNRTAAALGLTGTRFENPIGLDSASNYSTAGDLAALTLRLRKDPAFRRIVAAPNAVLKTGARTREITNRNVLVAEVPWVNGVKTGHTLNAGYVLVGSATRKGATLVSVVLGASSEAARDDATLELLDYGFSLYRREIPIRAGDELAQPDLKYQGESLPLEAERDLRIPVRRGQEMETSISAPGEVEGPIRRGQELGEVTATVDGRKVGTMPLVAARAAGEASFLQRARARLPGPLALIAIGAGVILIGVAATRRRSGRGRAPEQRIRSHEERMQRREQERTEASQGEGP